MPNTNLIKRKSAGLYSQGNPVHEAPEGALAVADNAVIDREGVIAKRRGFKRYGEQLSNPPSGLFEFLKTLIVLDGTTLRYDSNGAGDWTAWTGSFTPPSGSRMISIEAAKNFYFTTNLGLWKNDTLSGTPIQAGLPQPLEANTIQLAGIGGSWFEPDSQVAYRFLFTRKDANDNLHQSAPSMRMVVTNPKTAVTLAFAAGTVTVTHASHGYATNDIVEIIDPSDPAFEEGPHTITVTGGSSYTYTVAGTPPGAGTAFAGKARNVTFSIGVPQDLKAGDTFELYRSELSADQTTDPGDELFLIFSKVLTSGNISSGFNFTDVYAEAFLGLRLYTNELEEGLGAANDRPPMAHYVQEFKGHFWYAKTQQESFFEVQLIDLSTVAVGTDTLTIDGLVYTFAAAEDTADREFQVFSSGTVSQNIENTAKSLRDVVNFNSSSNLYAFYISGPDDPPGKLLFQRRTISSDVVQIVSTVGEAFLPNLDSALTFTIDVIENRLYRSKFQQPEAVPYLNWEPVGSRSKGFLGLAATEDFLLIYKEDGLYVASGESDRKLGKLFVIEQRDSTLRLTVPASLCALDNSIIGFTQQGIQKSTGQGSYIVSRQIEPDLLRTAIFDDFDTVSFSVAYESEKRLLFFTKRRRSSDVADVAWCWNYITNAWTRWKKAISCGLTHSSRNKLYLGDALSPFVLEERKGYLSNDTDFMDDDLGYFIANLGTTTDAAGNPVTTLSRNATADFQIAPGFVSSGPMPDVGWIIGQNGKFAKVVSIGTPEGSLLILDRLMPTFENSVTVDAVACKPIELALEWFPEAGGDLAALKQIPVVQFCFERNTISRLAVGFKSNKLVDQDGTLLNVSDFENLSIVSRKGWGRARWGTAWGHANVEGFIEFRPGVPMEHQVCSALGIRLRHKMGMESFALIQHTLEARPISTRVNSLPK